MNIMKTNMLSLDNKIAKEQKANLSATAVLSAAQPQAGMNALMFQGLQNLMANPKLASGVGVMKDDVEPEKEDAAKSYVAPFSTNMAFKGAPQAAIKTLGAAALAAAVGMAATSCKEKDEIKIPEINVVQNVEVKVDLSAVTALLANIQYMIADFMAQSNENNAELIAFFQQYANQNHLDNVAIQNLLNDLGAKVFDKLDTNNAFQQVIISLLEKQMTRDEAIALFNQLSEQIDNHTITVADAMKIIMDKLDLVNQNLEKINQTIQDASKKASEERALLSKQACIIIKQGYATIQQQQQMIAQNNSLIAQNNVIINNQNVIAQKIDNAALSINATITECANYLGMKVDDLAAIVVRTGKSLEEVMKMSKAEIVAAINANTAELQTTNYKLDVINTSVQSVDLSVQDNTGVIVQAASDILDVLNEISGKLDELSAKLGQFYNSYLAQYNDYTALLKEIAATGHFTAGQTAMLNNQVAALRADVNKIKLTAIEIRDNLQNGVEIDYNQLKEMFDILNINQDARKDEIIAKLNEFIAGQEKIEVAINKLGDNLGDKIAYLTVLVKNKTADNSDIIAAINEASQANEQNIAAATEKVVAALKTLEAKADAILNNMDGLAANLKQYVDQILASMDGNSKKILAQIKANGDKIDVTNATLAELKAELAKLKPLLESLNKEAKTNNTYLDLIANRQLQIQQAIENLENIAGGGITKDELEELWKAHDANAFATAKAYLDGLHADNMDKADEIIGYLKKGNQTAGDIYQLLLDKLAQAGEDREALKKLVQAIYDYLPELICKCQCGSDCGNNDTVHEGIIGIID